MARVRTSLKERGQQILGLKRRERAERALLGAWSKMGLRPPAGSGNSGVEAASPVPVRTRSPLSFKELDPDIERRIESLLDAEAAAAVGEDVQTNWDADHSSPDIDGPLPVVEWISPEPATMPRPDPAPPPSIPDTAPESAPPALTIPEEDMQPERVPPPDAAAPAVSPRQPEKTAFEPPQASPTVGQLPSDIPQAVPLTSQEEAALLQREDVHRYLTALEGSIRSQYERILRDRVSGSPEITSWCHGLLAEARTIVTYRRLGDLALAEWNVEQVRARLDRAEASDREWRWPAVITLWGIACLFSFLYLIFYPTIVLPGLTGQAAESPFTLPWVFLQALFFGGIGSVAAIFHHLFKYVRDRSFDRQHVLSYFGKPFLGMILGCLVYLAFFILVRLVGLVSPVEILGRTTGTVTNILYTAPLLFVALVAGFKENLVLEVLNRLLRSTLRV